MKNIVPALLLSLWIILAQEGTAQSGPWAKFNNKMKGEALVRDASGGYLEEVRSIVAGGGDVNWQLQPSGLSPLMAAASAGNTDVVRFLLGQGADPLLTDENGKTALDRARQDGANDIVKLLDYYIQHKQLPEDARKGAAPTGPWAKFNNRMKGQALVRDASGGYLEEVKSIVTGGGDVNWQLQPSGLSPLMSAASGGHTDIVRYLLSQGADPALKDENGKTALDYARQSGANDIVKLLEQYGKKAPAPKPAANPVGVPTKKPTPGPAANAPQAKKPAPAPTSKPVQQPPANTTTGNRTSWPPLGTYQPGDSVMFFAAGWKRGVIKEVGKSYNAASKYADAFENKYLVAPDAYANWPDYMNWSQVVQPKREPFWTAWFLGDWKLGEVMAVTTEEQGSYERNVYSYHSATDVLRINANGTYQWKPMKGKEISGKWSAAPDGPGIVLHKGYRGLDWTIRNESTATEMHIRKIENARLYPSAAYETSMAAKRPMK
jgi:ankyrin repeat protein